MPRCPLKRDIGPCIAATMTLSPAASGNGGGGGGCELGGEGGRGHAMPPAFTCMGMRTLANQGLKWLEQAISSVAVQLLLNRLELEPKWLRTSVLALLLKLLLCCVVLGGVIVIVECMARIFIYFHIHIYTHLR